MQRILPILLVALLMASCGGREVRKTEIPQAEAASVQRLPEAVTARVGMDITGSDMTCAGRLRMLRDDVVQLNLVFLGMNIGTLEFTPDSILLVDRVNRQYVYATYDAIDAFREREITFPVLQGLFWGESMSGRDDGQILWTYKAYGRVNRHKIPSSHVVRFKDGNLETGFDMTLTEIDNDRRWATRTQIDTSKFTRRDPNLLFRALLNM